MTEKKKAVRFFALCMAVLLVCSVFIWGFQSNWGDVKISRIYINGPDGTQISSLLYVPENATNETPAPCAVVFHGRSNHGHSNDTWSMELARRGYVVLSPDLQGGGESAVTVNRDLQAVYVTEYANNLKFIQKDKLNLIGYSAGTATVATVYRAMPDTVHSVCQVFGPFMAVLYGGITDFDTNFCMIKSTADQYDGDFLGDPTTCLNFIRESSGIADLQPGVDTTWKDGKFFRYAQIDGTLHQTGNISGTTINEILSYEAVVNDEPIAVNGTVWLWQQLFSGIACVAMMFLLAASVNLLMQLDYFSTIANAVPVKPARAKGKEGTKAWAIDFLFALVIPALIFVHVSAYAIKWTSGTWINKIWTSSNLNGIMVWLLVVAVIGIIRMVLAANKRKKAGIKDTLGTYALGADGDTKIDWSKPGKAFIMGIIVLTFVGVWMRLIEGFAGINYQVWNLSTYLQFAPMRITRAIPYMLIIFTVMFIGNMSQRILPSTGDEKKDMRRAVIINTCMTASALFVLLLIQYGGSMIIGTGYAPIPQIDIYGTGQNKSCGSLDFAFGYCYMMGGTTGVVTYLYRKYGNIWVGVIPAALFAGMVTLSGFTIVA